MVDPTGPRNPWGSPQPQNNNNRPNPGAPRPDLNDLFGRAQRGLNSVLPGGSAGIGPVIALLGVLWLGSGLYLVSPGEDAVIQRFGAWTRTQTDPGIGYNLPWPVESRTIVNTDLDRRLVIGFDNDGRRGQSAMDESLMLTEDANIVDINVVILWNVSRAEDYLFNVVEPDSTIKQVAESALREAVGQAPLQKIITEGRNDVASRMQDRLQSILDNYKAGVAIKQVLIQEATVHPDVIEAFDDVVAARQDGERFQNEATIYRNDVIPAARGEAIKMTQEAEAYKESQIAKANGDAQRFNSVYAAYVSGKDVTRERIYIETMESVLKNAHTVVLDKNGSQGAVPVLPLPGMATLPTPPSPTTSAAGVRP